MLFKVNDLLIIKFQELYKHSRVYSSLSKGYKSYIHYYK